MPSPKIDLTKFHNFAGSHYEMGLQQGEIFAENYKAGFETFKYHEGMNNMRPKWIPRGLFFLIARYKAFKDLSGLFERYTPNQYERIRGMVDGSGLPEKLIYLLLGSELVLGEPTFAIPAVRKGCTSIGYRSSKTARGHPMVSRNFDFEKFISLFLCMRKNTPNGKYASHDITASPLPGTFNGINEKGLFLGTDEAYPLEGTKPGLPASMLIQEALENAADSHEAFEIIKSLPRGSGNCILINDSQGQCLVAEYTSEEIQKREIEDGKDYLIATNHYLHPDLEPNNIPAEAVFDANAPKALHGWTINKNSYTRMETADNILKSKEEIGVDDIKQLHRDHSLSEGKGGHFDICHHDPVNITAASMIFDLETLDSWICFGSPCENTYKYFQLDQH